MVVNIKEIVDLIEKELDKSNEKMEYVEVVVPIIAHTKTDDNMVISTEGFTTVCSPESVSFVGYGNNGIGRLYSVYDDFYRYGGEKDFHSIREYLEQYHTIQYGSDTTNSIVYYREDK